MNSHRTARVQVAREIALHMLIGSLVPNADVGQRNCPHSLDYCSEKISKVFAAERYRQVSVLLHPNLRPTLVALMEEAIERRRREMKPRTRKQLAASSS